MSWPASPSGAATRIAVTVAGVFAMALWPRAWWRGQLVSVLCLTGATLWFARRGAREGENEAGDHRRVRYKPTDLPRTSVGQPFQAAGPGGFPAASSHEIRETGESPQPADKNVCPTSILTRK